MGSYFKSVISPARRDIWEEIASRDPRTMIFQEPVWTDGLISLDEYEDASRQYETWDGRILILPIVRRRDVIPAFSSLASMPDGWGMGGVITSQVFTTEDAGHILADLSGLPEYQISLRANPLEAPVWSTTGHERLISTQRETHILDLSGGFDTVWSKRFPSATRTKIRKAEKDGVEIITGQGGELLDIFYDLYLQWIDRRAQDRKMPRVIARWLGKKREPLLKFQATARVLGPAFQIWVARVSGQPVAAAILLFGRHQAVYWRSASLKEQAGPIRANDLLQKRMIEAAALAGCSHYHMGESGGVESLKHFKARFGAEPYLYPAFYRERFFGRRVKKMIGQLTRQIEQQLVKEKQA